VLALRYTHRVTISNRRLIAFDKIDVTFRYTWTIAATAPNADAMTLSPDDFIYRFLLHILLDSLHRMRIQH
jgi:hypothetical protein